MSTLSEATSKTVEQLGLRRVEASQPQQQATSDTSVSISETGYTRCPVPPVSISPDSLSTYNQEGKTPQSRFLASLPLFSETSSGNSTTTVVQGSGESSGSGSSSSSSTSSSNILPANTGFTTPVISQNIPFTTNIQMAPLFILYKVAVSSPARVELYSTSSFQTLDQGRSASTPVSLGSENGIIGDFNLVLSSESPWICSPAPTGFNGDDPISSTVYITVTNLTASSSTVTVSLSYLPMGEI